MKLRRDKGKSSPGWQWFQLWVNKVKKSGELHKIKIKPIASVCINMTTEAELCGWFEGLYTEALELTSIADLETNKEKRSRIYNIDKKGY